MDDKLTGVTGPKDDSHAKKRLLTATTALLECDEDYFVMKQAVEQLYTIFSTITGISAEDMTSGEMRLPSGKAISPGAAAHCLLEFKRTAIFLRGIRQAISHLLTTEQAGPIRILYAGCGPYATLITPLLQLYTSQNLQIDLLDINPVSLAAARKVMNTFGFEDHIGNYLLEDGATYQIPQGCHYHILLSETMQACLDHEPQVSILRNLVPQLAEECLLIPEEITIDARLTNPRQELAKFYYSETPKPPPERILLGRVFTINRERLEHEGGEVTIPDQIGNCYDLHLFTRVHIFADQILDENDSSITLPKKYYDFRQRGPVQRIQFFYDLSPGKLPKMSCRAIEMTEEAV